MIESESEKILLDKVEDKVINNNNNNINNLNNENNSNNLNKNNSSNRRNILVLRKDLIRDRFENYYFPNQLDGFLDKLDYHSAIGNINCYRSSSLLKYNLAIYGLSFLNFSIFLLLCFLSIGDPDFLIVFCTFFPILFLIFYIIIKVLTFYKFRRYIYDIDILFLGINESFEKSYNITFNPVYHKTFKFSMFSIISEFLVSNTCIELTQIEIQYPTSPSISNSSKILQSFEVDGANNNINYDIVGSTSLAGSPFTQLV